MIFASVGRLAGWRVGGVNDYRVVAHRGGAFLAMAHAFKHGDFVRVTLLLEAVNARTRRALEIGALLIAAFAIGYLAFWAARFTLESHQFGDIAGGLVVIPIWIPQLTFVVGALLFWLAVVDELVLVLRGAKPTYVAPSKSATRVAIFRRTCSGRTSPCDLCAARRAVPAPGS